MHRRGRVPDGLPEGGLTRHEEPLERPSQATKISKPNRFAYPFRSRPRGVGSPLWLNSPAAKTSSYRDTANLGVGVRPRPSWEGSCHGLLERFVTQKMMIYYDRCSIILYTIFVHLEASPSFFATLTGQMTSMDKTGVKNPHRQKFTGRATPGPGPNYEKGV